MGGSAGHEIDRMNLKGKYMKNAFNFIGGSAVRGNGATAAASEFQCFSRGSLTWVSNNRVNPGSLLIAASGSDLIGTGSIGATMGAR